jgi:hypothetical protein
MFPFRKRKIEKHINTALQTPIIYPLLNCLLDLFFVVV